MLGIYLLIVRCWQLAPLGRINCPELEHCVIPREECRKSTARISNTLTKVGDSLMHYEHYKIYKISNLIFKTKQECYEIKDIS